VPTDTCTLADVPDGLADTPAWTAGAVARAADDELSCAAPPSEADPATGATDSTADAAAPTVLVTAPTVPVTALPAVPVTAPATVPVTPPTVPVTAPATVPVTAPTVFVTAPATVPVTAATVPVAPGTAWPTVVTVVPTVPLVPAATDTVVGVVPDEPGAGLCPVGGRPEPMGRVDGDPAPLPLLRAGFCPWLPPAGRSRGGPPATG
jgi:hypothetical protein